MPNWERYPASCSTTSPQMGEGARGAHSTSALLLPRSGGKQAIGTELPSDARSFSTPGRFRWVRSLDAIVRNRMTPATAVSRRNVLRALTAAVSTLTLGGCAGLASTGSTRSEASALSVTPVLLVATTRKPVNGARGRPWFGPERGTGLGVARAKLTPPIEGGFSLAPVGLEDWRIETVQPVPRVADLLGQWTSARDVLIYVHGFNQTFEGAALDAAHLSDNIKFRGETMVFSWPSRAKLLDYAYDRESAMWSRDAFQQVLEGLMAGLTAGRIHIVAHSVGTMLTMEVLRQLYARDGDAAAQRIGAVVFASPDIDMDVFTSSVERIGPLLGHHQSRSVSVECPHPAGDTPRGRGSEHGSLDVEPQQVVLRETRCWLRHQRWTGKQITRLT